MCTVNIRGMGNKILATLGRRVRDRRIALGLSQEKLGELAGLHRNLIGLIERGETNPTLLNLSRLAKALRMSLVDLLKGL